MSLPLKKVVVNHESGTTEFESITKFCNYTNITTAAFSLAIAKNVLPAPWRDLGILSLTVDGQTITYAKAKIKRLFF